MCEMTVTLPVKAIVDLGYYENNGQGCKLFYNQGFVLDTVNKKSLDWEAKFQCKWRLGQEWKWQPDMSEEGRNVDLIKFFASSGEGVGGE